MFFGPELVSRAQDMLSGKGGRVAQWSTRQPVETGLDKSKHWPDEAGNQPALRKALLAVY